MIAGLILLFFGVKMIYEAYKNEGDSEEEKEIEQELMGFD